MRGSGKKIQKSLLQLQEVINKLKNDWPGNFISGNCLEDPSFILCLRSASEEARSEDEKVKKYVKLMLYFMRNASNRNDGHYREMLELIEKNGLSLSEVAFDRSYPASSFPFEVFVSLRESIQNLKCLQLLNLEIRSKSDAKALSDWISNELEAPKLKHFSLGLVMEHCAGTESWCAVLDSLSNRRTLEQLELEIGKGLFDEGCLEVLCASLRQLDKVKRLRIVCPNLDQECFGNLALRLRERILLEVLELSGPCYGRDQYKLFRALQGHPSLQSLRLWEKLSPDKMVIDSLCGLVSSSYVESLRLDGSALEAHQFCELLTAINSNTSYVKDLSLYSDMQNISFHMCFRTVMMSESPRLSVKRPIDFDWERIELQSIFSANILKR